MELPAGATSNRLAACIDDISDRSPSDSGKHGFVLRNDLGGASGGANGGDHGASQIPPTGAIRGRYEIADCLLPIRFGAEIGHCREQQVPPEMLWQR